MSKLPPDLVIHSNIKGVLAKLTAFHERAVGKAIEQTLDPKLLEPLLRRWAEMALNRVATPSNRHMVPIYVASILAVALTPGLTVATMIQPLEGDDTTRNAIDVAQEHVRQMERRGRGAMRGNAPSPEAEVALAQLNAAIEEWVREVKTLDEEEVADLVDAEDQMEPQFMYAQGFRKARPAMFFSVYSRVAARIQFILLGRPKGGGALSAEWEEAKRKLADQIVDHMAQKGATVDTATNEVWLGAVLEAWRTALRRDLPVALIQKLRSWWLTSQPGLGL